MFEAGAETTSLLICLVMHRLLTERALIDRVRDGGEPLRRLVDETLRHSTVVHWRPAAPPATSSWAGCASERAIECTP
ncbi:MAG: hypothetical protein R3C32_02265 [Chloroflexota bacterium]